MNDGAKSWTEPGTYESEELKAKVLTDSENAADREFAVADNLYQHAVKYFEFKETEIGAEMYGRILRFIALQSIDNLWMEHLDTMDHLRDSVRLRGYGQRDPLVEYRREGFGLFKRLTTQINKQIVYAVLKVTVQVQPQTPPPVVNLVTNLSDGSGDASVKSDAGNDSTIGRNDPCPCGSGKKFKKCGLINSKEHQSFLNKK
jgi:preprotein translocase subunit SecA